MKIEMRDSIWGENEPGIEEVNENGKEGGKRRRKGKTIVKEIDPNCVMLFH